MAEDRPVWRQGFDTVEQTVAPRIEEIVNSEQFAIAAGIVARAQKTARRRAERTTRRLLHLVNLPAGSDVTRLLNEIGKLQTQVRELSRQVDEGKAKTKGDATDGGPTGIDRPAGTRPTRR